MQEWVLIDVLASSLLSGELNADHARARIFKTLGRPSLRMGRLARRFVKAFAGRTRPCHCDVVEFLRRDAGFKRAWTEHRNELSIAQWIPEPQQMQPVAAAAGWALPAIESLGELADWLSVTVGDLEWFADLKDLNRKGADPKLEHYRYRILPKRSGGVRLTESPKPCLKEMQRRILSEILNQVPVHSAVHGFAKGRSIVSFAAPHVGKRAVLRLDLQDFFPTFPAARVQALFRTLGYPESVADRLAGICTNAVPRRVWANRPTDISAARWYETRTLYARPHLPQGAPTSPALANLMAYRLDCRLSGLAKSADAAYTRYADDLVFSGDESFARGAGRFAAHAAAVAMEEGFRVNHRKTRIMRQGMQQRVAGIVVNRKVSLRRKDIDLLEAILTNCVRHGPESQNRDRHPNFRAHLEGRVGFVEMVNPRNGQQLRELLKAVKWDP